MNQAKLISVTPDAEEHIAYCARVSNPSNQENEKYAGLIKYCIKHQHWSFFEQALLLDPKDPDLWNYKGAALRSLGRYADSMECFNNSLKLYPRDKFSS